MNRLISIAILKTLLMVRVIKQEILFEFTLIYECLEGEKPRSSG